MPFHSTCSRQWQVLDLRHFVGLRRPKLKATHLADGQGYLHAESHRAPPVRDVATAAPKRTDSDRRLLFESGGLNEENILFAGPIIERPRIESLRFAIDGGVSSLGRESNAQTD
jgi:hypothetical protein